ncbi:PQQ-binding-like beta-propeller repeat protein [Candidatus Poribacteria bacterium]
MKIRLAFILLVTIVLTTPASAENWAQWRGPFLNGSTSETNLPATWSKTENVLWTVKMPGPGQSTPIIWEDRVFVTAIEEESEKMWAVCLNRADGRELWKHEIGTGFFGRTGNTGASPSPIVDGKRVYFLYGTTDFVAFDMDGQLLWQRNIEEDHGRMQINFRYGASPLLYQDKLYLAVMHRYSRAEAEPGKPAVSYLLCIDSKTGKDLWKQERLTDATGEGMEAYTTPYLFEGPNGPVIIVAGGDYVTAHHPADGKEVWRSPDYNPQKRRAYRLVPSPVALNGMIIACEPRGSSMFAIKGGGTGQLLDDSFAWVQWDNAPDVCTPLVMDGKLFVLDGQKKVMSCLNPETGEAYWRGSLGVSKGFQASPTGADGKIYCISMGGEVVVLSAGDAFEILSRIDMGEGVCRATISAAHGQLFVRTAESLYCIGNGTE